MAGVGNESAHGTCGDSDDCCVDFASTFFGHGFFRGQTPFCPSPSEWTERMSGPCRADFAVGPIGPTRSSGRSTSVHEARQRRIFHPVCFGVGAISDRMSDWSLWALRPVWDQQVGDSWAEPRTEAESGVPALCPSAIWGMSRRRGVASLCDSLLNR
jgi:hypothetical protein